MALQTGSRVPAGELQTMGPDGATTVNTDEIFGGKKVVLFGVPGAFTPTCSDTHLPGFLLRTDELRAKGVDTVACVSVNDVFVMDAWARERRVGDRLLMLADGNGSWVRALGLTLDATGFGMGMRSKRFAAIVDDGVVTMLNVEPGPGVEGSSAEAVLAALG